MIDELFEESIFELEKIVQNSAKVLSELTKYTAIVLGPTVEDHKLSKFQIIPLNDDSAVAIIVTNTVISSINCSRYHHRFILPI